MKNASLTSLTLARSKKSFVALLILCSACLLPSAQGAVTVDQTPLTVQSIIAPNIVLLLDDSGSMAWNFMPDLCSGTTAYLNGVTCDTNSDPNAQPNNDALTNASNNFVYYNPKITYTPPIKADGTSFPNSPGLTGAYADGLIDTAHTQDVTTYAATSTYNSAGRYYAGTYDKDFVNQTLGRSNVAFSISTAAISATCASGYSIVNLGTYQSTNYNCAIYGTQTPSCSSGTYDPTTGTCAVTAPSPSCPNTYTFNGTTCTGTQVVGPSCPSNGAFNASTGLCTVAPNSCGSGYSIQNISTTSSPNYQCRSTTTATPSCTPNTGTYQSSTGTCTLNTAPNPTCSSGTLTNTGTSGSPNWQCVIPATTPGCTPNTGTYKPSTGTCTLNTPPNATCGTGTLTNVGTSGSPNWQCVTTPGCTPNTGTYKSTTGTCTVMTPPNPSCGSGFALTNTGTSGSPNWQCTDTNSPPDCPSGYTFRTTGQSNAGLCRKGTGSTAVFADPTCTPPYTLTGTGGAAVCYAVQTPNCGAYSYISSNKTCVATPPPTPSCGTGFTLTGSGASTTCISSDASQMPSCGANYNFNASTKLCVASPAPTPSCGTGFTLTGSGASTTCVSTSDPTAATCGANYNFNTSTKLCVASPAPTPSCSGSNILVGSGSSTTCATTKTATCPTGGYTYNSSISGSSCTFTATPTNCPSGSTGTGSGTTLICSQSVTATPTCSSGTFSSGVCVVTPPTPTCSTSGYVVTNISTTSTANYQCAGYTTGTTATCSSGTYSSTLGQCTVTGTPTKTFFQYSTGPAAGPYVNYYVASSTQGCVNVPHSSSHCVDENDTSGTSAPNGVKAGQNIANWFSYYRTRMLTAKSGLTTAFDKLDPTIRLGFASINGRNNAGLPGSPYGTGSTQVANVSAFDQSCVTDTPTPCAKGQSGTQRANFWSWVIGESTGGGTALRSALDTLGQYYMQDGPWQNSSADSTKLACRQSYAIATTDGFWNDPSPPSPGNVDNTTGTQITGPNGQKYIYKAVAPFSGSTSNTLADVAMKYWSTDLQTSVANEVPTGSADPAFWQHMTTFTLGLGFTPTNITPSGTKIDDIFVWAKGADSSIGTVANSKIPSDFSWPAPASNSINNIADLAHAGVNGHGGFYSATSPKSFSDGIADAISRVSSRAGTGASLAANSTKLGTGTVTYQARYFSGIWSGDLTAYAVDPSSGAIATTESWSASKALPTAANRNIKTYNPSGTTSTTKFVAFTDPTTLSTAEQTALGADTTSRQNVIDYLRGDATKDTKHGGTYRSRDTALGDIVNSQPVYVGAPTPNLFFGRTFTGSGDYPAFATTNLTRNPVIWVAANDGMLHAFKASDGTEVFAYLPAAVITNGLVNLSNTNYGSLSIPHQLYNDGQITVADVYTALPSSSTVEWRTVLVGTTGLGTAKAIYALDVTNPASPIFLWEKSAADSDDIGQIAGQPVIAQTADGVWSVLVGNGYNSVNKKAALLQFNVMTGALTVHATDTTTDNALAAPAVWIGTVSNGIGTVAYAGDLKGRVWSFILNNGTSSTPSSAGSVVFTTTDGGTPGKAQPITGGMLAGSDQTTGNVWLFFGTGQYLTHVDLNNTDTQSWYGIIVQSTTASLVTNLSTWTGSRTAGTSNALVPRSITAQTNGTSTKLPARTITVPTDGDTSGKSGWFIDLLKPTAIQQGERMVTPNQFQGKLLLGTSRVPVVTDLCNPSGSGWIMAVDPWTGGNPDKRFFDLNSDGKFDENDQVGDLPAGGIGFGSVANNPIFVGNTMLVSFDNATTSSIDTAGTVGNLSRLSWRELVTH